MRIKSKIIITFIKQLNIFVAIATIFLLKATSDKLSTVTWTDGIIILYPQGLKNNCNCYCKSKIVTVNKLKNAQYKVNIECWCDAKGVNHVNAVQIIDNG